MSEGKQQLAGATMLRFIYDDVKKQTKTIYNNLSTNKIKRSTTETKVEPTYKV